jgi:hypothetical protein
MKPLLLSFALASFFFGPVYAEPLQADWLEQGCAAVITLDSGSRGMTKQQLEDAVCVSDFIGGFLLGINAAGFIGKDAETYSKASPALFTPPDDFLKPNLVAHSVSSFISKNKARIPAHAPAARIMAAWYYASHPKANDLEKALSDVILDELKKNGELKHLESSPSKIDSVSKRMEELRIIHEMWFKKNKEQSR